MILPTTSAQPSNDYTEADVQDDERVDPQAARAPSAWPLLIASLMSAAMPLGMALYLCWGK